MTVFDIRSHALHLCVAGLHYRLHKELPSGDYKKGKFQQFFFTFS